MGITIARKGIDRAYNLYVYSSYKGIQEAINIANAEANDSDGGLIPARLMTTEGLSIFISSLLQTLSGKILTVDKYSAKSETPNGVTYEIHESFRKFVVGCEGDARSLKSINNQVERTCQELNSSHIEQEKNFAKNSLCPLFAGYSIFISC